MAPRVVYTDKTKAWTEKWQTPKEEQKEGGDVAGTQRLSDPTQQNIANYVVDAEAADQTHDLRPLYEKRYDYGAICKMFVAAVLLVTVTVLVVYFVYVASASSSTEAAQSSEATVLSNVGAHSFMVQDEDAALTGAGVPSVSPTMDPTDSPTSSPTPGPTAELNLRVTTTQGAIQMTGASVEAFGETEQTAFCKVVEDLFSAQVIYPYHASTRSATCNVAGVLEWPTMPDGQPSNMLVVYFDVEVYADNTEYANEAAQAYAVAEIIQTAFDGSTFEEELQSSLSIEGSDFDVTIQTQF